MPLPAASVTTKSAVQEPAPPLTTGTSALPAACGPAKAPCPAIEVATRMRAASHILREFCMRTPLAQTPSRAHVNSLPFTPEKSVSNCTLSPHALFLGFLGPEVVLDLRGCRPLRF